VHDDICTHKPFCEPAELDVSPDELANLPSSIAEAANDMASDKPVRARDRDDHRRSLVAGADDG
jgi:hypothetical protein